MRGNIIRTTASGRYELNNSLAGDGRLNIKMGDSNVESNQAKALLFTPRPTLVWNKDVSDQPSAIYRWRDHPTLDSGRPDMNQSLIEMRQDRIKYGEGEDLIPTTNPIFDLSSPSMSRVDNPANETAPYFSFNGDYSTNKPVLIDERMNRRIAEREYTERSDQIREMQNLKNSPEYWDRIAKQEAADRALLGLGEPTNRYSEASAAYNRRGYHLPSDVVRKNEKRRLAEDWAATELGKNYFAVNQQRDMEYGLTPEFGHPVNYNPNFIHNRSINRYSSIDKEFEEFHHRIMSLENKIRDLYERVYHEQYPSMRYENEMDPSYYFSTNEHPNSESRRPIRYTLIERDVMDEIPDIEGKVASTLINESGDRMMVARLNGDLYILSRPSTNPDDDRISFVRLPMEYEQKSRIRIHDSEGRHFKEISLDDFHDIIGFINQHPEMTQQGKVSIRDLYSSLIDSDIDRRMLEEFSGNKVFSALTFEEIEQMERASTKSNYVERNQIDDKPSTNPMWRGEEQISELRPGVQSNGIGERKFSSIDSREVDSMILNREGVNMKSIDRKTNPNFQLTSLPSFSRYRK